MSLFAGRERRKLGAATRRVLYGNTALLQRGRPTDHVAPDFSVFADEVVYGGIWARPGLDLRTRVLVTLTLDLALGRHHHAATHLKAATNVGVTQGELVELALQLSAYAGVSVGRDLLMMLSGHSATATPLDDQPDKM